MKLILLNDNKFFELILPSKIDGSFWLTDEITNNNIINIEAQDEKWVMKQNSDTKIIASNVYVESVEICPNNFYFLENNNKKLILYVENIYDDTIKHYKLNTNTFTLGKDSSCDIVYNNNFIFNNYLMLSFNNNVWTITINGNSSVYVNKSHLKVITTTLNNGDSIFVMGLRITLYNNAISINNPFNGVQLNNSKFVSEEKVDRKQDKYYNNFLRNYEGR